MLDKAIRLLLSLLLVYAVLVSTHLGEFWPFSIFPMFSKAGNPWTRALVREVPPSDTLRWEAVYELDKLPGEPFAMNQVGINTNDLANFVSKNKQWSRDKIGGMRSYFRSRLDDQAFIVYKVQGRLSSAGGDSVIVEYMPLLLMKPDTTLVNPNI